MVEYQEVPKERLALSVAEAAKELSCSKVLVYQLIREGRIPSVRLSKRRIVVPRKALEMMLNVKALSVGQDYGQNKD